MKRVLFFAIVGLLAISNLALSFVSYLTDVTQPSLQEVGRKLIVLPKSIAYFSGRNDSAFSSR